jgi:hypothetical protein
MRDRWANWPWGLRWLTGIATVALVVVIAWVLFVPVSDWLAHHDVGSIKGMRLQTARDAARGRLLTLGAGLFAAGALVYTARSYSLSRESQVTDRYTKAIEQLGSKELVDVRIGGIYALERIARDSPRDHPTVMEVLSAFVREHSREPWPPPADHQSDAGPRRRTTRPDVQAAVTVIARRKIQHDDQRVNLAEADLTRQDLTAAHLTGAHLNGANLTRANLSKAVLIDATLFGANLTGAKLLGANLTRANLHLAHLDIADLGVANLTSADLTSAELPGADLRGANLSKADLTEATLTRANLSEADLTDAKFPGTDLTFARWPAGAEVPAGWQRGTDSDVLEPANTDSDNAAPT